MWNDVSGQQMRIGGLDLIVRTRRVGTVTEAVTEDGRSWFTAGSIWLAR